jgi:hypothetical protein
LITDGRGGYLNLLLGSADEGRDVFIYTNSQLVLGDNDTAGDIYDVRIDGGYPPSSPAPVECEGDACSTPAAAPIDATPSSFTFSGAGNLISEPSKKPAAKSKKKKKKKVAKRKPKARKNSKRKPQRAKKSLGRSKR